MHYAYEYQIETANTIDNPVIGEMQLGAGWLRHVSITFPAGCNRHVHAIIADRATQILPTNVEGEYAENDYCVEIECWIELPSENNLLYFYGWSEDASWPHTLSVLLDVEGPDEPNIYRAMSLLAGLVERLVDLIKKAF